MGRPSFYFAHPRSWAVVSMPETPIFDRLFRRFALGQEMHYQLARGRAIPIEALEEYETLT